MHSHSPTSVCQYPSANRMSLISVAFSVFVVCFTDNLASSTLSSGTVSLPSTSLLFFPSPKSGGSSLCRSPPSAGHALSLAWYLAPSQLCHRFCCKPPCQQQAQPWRRLKGKRCHCATQQADLFVVNLHPRWQGPWIRSRKLACFNIAL